MRERGREGERERGGKGEGERVREGSTERVSVCVCHSKTASYEDWRCHSHFSTNDGPKRKVLPSVCCCCAGGGWINCSKRSRRSWVGRWSGRGASDNPRWKLPPHCHNCFSPERPWQRQPNPVVACLCGPGLAKWRSSPQCVQRQHTHHHSKRTNTSSCKLAPSRDCDSGCRPEQRPRKLLLAALGPSTAPWRCCCRFQASRSVFRSSLPILHTADHNQPRLWKNVGANTSNHHKLKHWCVGAVPVSARRCTQPRTPAVLLLKGAATTQRNPTCAGHCGAREP